MCQFLRTSGLTAANRWELVQQFDHGWRFHVENLTNEAGEENRQRHKARAVDTSIVAMLDDEPAMMQGSGRGTRTSFENRVLLECRFLDGLLAIHRGGGILRLLHPFSDSVSRDQTMPVLWSESEGSLLASAEQRLPQVEYEPQWFRPYPPQMTQDRRFAIFATPYLCTALDLWTLPGWGASQKPACRLLLAFDENSPVRLAAAPIPLTVQSWPFNQTGPAHLQGALQPNRIGFLLRHNDGSYWWCNTEIEHFFGDDTCTARKELVECISQAIRFRSGKEVAASAASMLGIDQQGQPPWCVLLPLEGDAVQVNWFRDQKLVFATDKGHWLWSPEDVRAGRVAGSRTAVLGADATGIQRRPAIPSPEKPQGPPAGGAVSGASSAESEDGNSGIWSIPHGSSRSLELDNQIVDRKNFSWSKQCLFSSNSGQNRNFEIAYTIDKCAMTRNVFTTDRRQTENSRPVESLKSCRGLLSWVAPDSLHNEMELLLVSGSDGAIHHRINTQHEPLRLENMQIGDINEIAGLQFRDPLLVVIRLDSARNAYEVQLRTLRHTSDYAVVGGLSLHADPVAWSNYLFTCEAEEGRICLKRRLFSVRASESNMHLNFQTVPGGDPDLAP